MFEFIVSGQIPGIPFQLTFNWALLLFAIGLGVYELRRVMRRRQFTLQTNMANLLLHMKLPTRRSRRKKTEAKQLKLV